MLNTPDPGLVAGRSTGVATDRSIASLPTHSKAKEHTPDPPALSRIELIQQLTDDYAATRSDLLSTDPFDQSAISGLDREYARELGRWRQVLKGKPSIIQKLFSHARVSVARSVFEEMRKPFYQLGMQLGLAQLRELNVERLHHLRSSYQRLLEITRDKYAEAFERYSKSDVNLEQALKATMKDGERNAIHLVLEADHAAVQVHREIGGFQRFWPFRWFIRIDRLRTILDEFSPSQIALVDQAYHRRHGIGLKRAFSRVFRRDKLLCARYMIKGDREKETAHRIAAILSSPWYTKNGRARVLREVYKSLGHDDIARVEQHLARSRICKQKLDVGHIDQTYAKKLHNQDHAYLIAQREDQQLRAETCLAYRLLKRGGKHARQARYILQEMYANASVEAFKREFFEQHGETVHNLVVQYVQAGPDKDLSLAILNGDEQHINAGLVRCHLHHRSDWVAAPFVDQPENKRMQLIEDYAAVYHAGDAAGFWQDLRQAVWREDYWIFGNIKPLARLLEKTTFPLASSQGFIRSIVDSGELSEAEALRFFWVGVGTDVDGVRALLSGKGSKEVEELAADYAHRYPACAFHRAVRKIPGLNIMFLTGDLIADMRSEHSGDERFDVEQMLKGEPKTLLEIRNRLSARYRHENSGKLLRLFNRVPLLSNRSVVDKADEDYRAAYDYYDKHLKGNKNYSHRHMVRFRTLARFAEYSLDQYRDAKQRLSKLASDTCAAIGMTAGALVAWAFPSVAYWTVACGAALGSCAFRTIIQGLISGRGYGREQWAVDMVRGMADGVTVFAARIARPVAFTVAAIVRFAGINLSEQLVRNGVRSSLYQAIKSVEQRIVLQRKAQHLMPPAEEPKVFPGPEETLERFTEQLRHISLAFPCKGSQHRGMERVFLRELLHSIGHQ